MMRALFPLALIVLASASDYGSCALNGAAAVDELMDSAVFIWASVERCGQAGETVRCEVNIASAIESVNGMLNVITKAVHQCGGLKDAKCGLAAGALTESFAGVAAASGGIVAKCDDHMQTVRGQMQATGTYASAKFGACIVDVKGSMKSLFLAIKRIMTVKGNCADAGSRDCAHNALKIVAGFAALGEHLAGAVSHCTSQAGGGAICASQSLKLTNELNNVAKAGVAMSQDCHAESDSRLYLIDEDHDHKKKKDKDTSSAMTLSLAAFLPITGVLSFVAGSRLAKVRSQQTAPQEELE